MSQWLLRKIALFTAAWQAISRTMSEVFTLGG